MLYNFKVIVSYSNVVKSKRGKQPVQAEEVYCVQFNFTFDGLNTKLATDQFSYRRRSLLF